METKKEKQPVKFVLYDSREEIPYEDYVENCEINDCEPAEEDSQDYWDWVNETRAMYWDDLKMNMCYSKIDYPLIITGSLGLWDGRHTIQPMIIESEGYGRKFTTCDYTGYELPSIKKAVEKACSGRSVEDFDVTYEDGVIYVNCYHHDGTNRFEIHKLSKKGIECAARFIEREPFGELKKEWFAKIRKNEIDF